MIGLLAGTRDRVITFDLSAGVVIPAMVVLTIVLLGLVSQDVPPTSFRSPDEHANYLYTKTFAETGRLYYTADYLRRDEENLLHPRGAITYRDRAVPFNFLGLPVLYAPAYHVLGENLRYVGVALALLTVSSLAMAGSLFVPQRRWVAWAAILGATPIVYYLNRPFLNTLPALAFLSLGLCLLLHYYRALPDRGAGLLWGGSAALAVAALTRYEFTLFAALFVAILFHQKYRGRLRPVVVDLLRFGFATAVFFLGPVLVLNYLTYGSPFTFGYGLFNDVYFPDRSGSGPIWESGLRMARALLLPSYPFDPALAFGAFTRQVLGVAPVFAIGALLGLVMVLRSRALAPKYVVAYSALAAYVFLYRGAGDSWLADSPTAHLEASVIRYALPLYVGFFLLTVYGLSRVHDWAVATALVSILALVGILGVLRDVDGSLLHVRMQVRAGDELTRTSVLPYTEPDAIIYTDVFDKIIGPHRVVATWWGGVQGNDEGFFDPDDVARSIDRVYPARPVYLYAYEDNVIVPEVTDALQPFGLTTYPVGPPRLYEVAPINDTMPDERVLAGSELARRE